MLSKDTLKVIEDFNKLQYFYNNLSVASSFYNQDERYRLFWHLKFLHSKIKGMVGMELFGPSVRGVYYETENGRLISSLFDTEISNCLGFQNGYGLPLLNVIKSFLEKNDILYVLGAHIGTMLIPLSNYCKYAYGFEPNPLSFDLLNSNLRINNIMNATVFNIGTFYKNTSLSFLQSIANSGGSKIEPKFSSIIYDYDYPDNIKISVVSLDDYIDKNNLMFPDVLIIDVEGAEYFSLLGAKIALKYCRLLFIEFTPHHLRNVANVSVEDFVSVILLYFDEMEVIGEHIRYEKKYISDVLFDYFENNISKDLIFLKIPD